MIVAYVLLALAVVAGNGTIWGLPLALAAAWCVVRALRSPDALRDLAPPVVAALIAIGALSSLVRAPANDLIDGTPRWPFALVSLAIGAVGVAACLRPRLAGRAALALVIVLSAALGGAIIIRSPSPHIDVFVLEQGGAQALRAQRNPYAITYSNPYDAADTQTYFGDQRTELRDYPYPPASLIATSVGYAIAGDVRWALWAAQLAIALLLYALARAHSQPRWLALALAVLFLSHPRGPFVLEQAWSDTLPALAFVALLYALATQRLALAALSLGAFLAFKQYGVVLLPLALRTVADRKSRGSTVPGRASTERASSERARLPGRAVTAVALAIAALLTLPFVLWDARAFIDDVLLFQLRQPFRMDAMSVPALVGQLTGWRAPGALALVAAAGAIAFAWRKLDSLATFALAASLAYLAFFLGAKQAFCNYYYFAGVLLLGSAACAAPMLSSLRDGG